MDILAKIQAGGDQTDPMVVAEWEEIITVLAAEREAPAGWRRFVKNGMWRRTFAGFSVQAWQQLSGANVMTYCRHDRSTTRHTQVLTFPQTSSTSSLWLA